MTRLNAADMRQLAGHYVVIPVDQSFLHQVGRENVESELAHKAAPRITSDSGQNVSAQELHSATRADDSTGIVEYRFRWDPQARGFLDVELIGGPEDGSMLKVTPEAFPKLRVSVMRGSQYIEPGRAHPVRPSTFGEYETSGWDTEKKKWLYEWKGSF